MFNITPTVARGPVQPNMPVRKQTAPAKPTHEPTFGLTTISGDPNTAAKARPITPAPTEYKTLGSRLDYYA
jgi:hypothetical protein